MPKTGKQLKKQGFFWNGELQDFKWIELKEMNEGERSWCHKWPPWRTSVSNMESYGNATASREETTLLIAETVTHN